MNCPACDQPNRPGAKRCKTCATPLPSTCLACGARSLAGSELCESCRTDRVPSSLGAEELFPTPPADATQISALPYELRPKFIGREGSLERLLTLVDKVRADGELGFVAVIGEPGAGKTRLTKELARALRTRQPDTRFLGASGAGQGTLPYAAFVRVLALRFGIVSADDAAVSQEKIIAGVGEVLPASKVPEVAHLIAYLLQVPFKDSAIVEPLAENPQQLETRTFIALKRFFAADAARGPLVLCFDDLERAGAETINLIHYLAIGLASSRVLLLCVARPSLFEAHVSFGAGEVAVSRIDLGALEVAEADQLFRELMRHAEGLPPSLVAHARKLGGLPRTLFELSRLLLEAEVIRRDPSTSGGWRFDTGKLLKLRLPLDHADILAQRLSAMPPGDRDLLEKASVVGEVFWLDAVVALVRVSALSTGDPDGPTLAEIAGSGDHTRLNVAQTLARLVEREWIVDQESTIPGEREYRFAYPPLWDVVYDALDHDTRRRYHRLVAQWLELRPEGRGEDSQEEVGQHLERAGEGDAAAARYRRAADSARIGYVNEKAIRLYAQALTCLGEGDLASRIQLWHDLGSVYELKGDFEAALGAFERMLRLTWVISSRAKAAVALNKIGRVWRRKGDLRLALEYLQRGKELFEQAEDARGIAGSLDDIGQALRFQGRYDEAFEQVTRGLALRGKTGDARSIAQSLSNLGNLQKDRGKLVEAENCHREALELRRKTGDRAGQIQCLNSLAVIAYDRGDHDAARRGWEEALREAEDIGALPLQVLCLNNLGEMALEDKKPEEARRRLDEAINLARDLDDRRSMSEASRNLALLELDGGNHARAKELALEAHAIAESAGIRDYVGRALLALGEVHAATLFDDQIEGADTRAEDYFLRGVELFRGLGNETELARGLERYGRFKLERGDTPGGRRLLEEATAMFSRLGMRVGTTAEQVLAPPTRRPAYSTIR